ncbi:MAG: pyrimidine-nucleoside phosphorylase, partial [Firmicutes bacterium]|nr:pyrimidine-nucleoside phosphorylase [Bacillota bacterium]
QPLGTHIGNALEVREAIDILAGRAGGRLKEVSLQLGAMMLRAGGYDKTEAEARARLEDALQSGRGLRKLQEMIEAQGGDPAVCDDVDLLPKAREVIPVAARAEGYIAKMDTTLLGEASQRLGAGRANKEDAIDPAVGIVMAVELGGYVQKGAPLARVHANDAAKAAEAMERVRAAVMIAPEKAPVPPLTYAVVRPEGVESFPA